MDPVVVFSHTLMHYVKLTVLQYTATWRFCASLFYFFCLFSDRILLVILILLLSHRPLMILEEND